MYSTIFLRVAIGDDVKAERGAASQSSIRLREIAQPISQDPQARADRAVNAAPAPATERAA